MHHATLISNLACRNKRIFALTQRWSSSSVQISTTRSRITPKELQSSQAYCADLLKKYDSPSYTLLAFVPSQARLAYIAIRAFNIEVARIADTASTPQVGALRLQFWRESIARIFEDNPPKQPVTILLHAAMQDLVRRSNGSFRLSKSWLLRIISAREQYLNNNPYATMESLEKYAESTYSTLLYLSLQALPMVSITADHVASHIGKASGIIAVLRGLPLLAFPPSPNHHTNNAGLDDMMTMQRNRSQQGSVTLPLDIMAEVGLREEDVLRKGSEATGLKDAVFKVATRASDHLITARSMVANLRKGQDIGHDFEHAAEEEHAAARQLEPRTVNVQLTEVEQAFGVFMPAVSTSLWLERLQKVDFDIFQDQLRRRDWRLPWKAWLANRRRLF